MKQSLFVKLVILYLFSAVFMFLLLNTYGQKHYEQKLVEEKKMQLYTQALSISNDYMADFYNQNLSPEDLTAKIKAMAIMLDSRIWIVNKNGIVISDTAPAANGSGSIDIFGLDPDFLYQSFPNSASLQNVLSEPMVSVVYKVLFKYQVRGYVVIHYSMNKIHTSSLSFTDTLNLCLLVFCALQAVIFSFLYFITVHPLNKINKAALEYTKGNYSYSIPVNTKDEYGALASSLSFMAGEIRNLDNYQKKFVANISHDFRSPLTSIKGYAEALQDGTIPYEMKDKYLGIILFETDRLNKLTSGLLTLNGFENKGILLEIASFDINHIIKKTAESFEGICKNKKITLNLIFSNKVTLVNADMGKIQQVLYNLLDNAIKFSHQNSIIKISTQEKGDKVFVSVKDYGIGIPKESINKVWERFYKTDSSRGKDKKGTGLGLSITKEIITAHNENINVVSTQGVGTEFIFTLPRTGGFI
ncbi:HAMP domain-containing sensor histidine kinase [Anaerocolumna xylanovorans]|uniref:histidine kinase n=1 Tax=Anaerocolumna xylanovorans DSM 12503 TaxID=1121345 RepID=A0A1M7Y6R1_9FIRM|nr:HAMP domain-containing sensor histidine kinase [Anaerocolumna xylanovorans]SHO48284.1 Signal transduction histidine kinase [Anaerocolumna xylanovorans DSM 12503]